MARQGKDCSIIATHIPTEFTRRHIDEYFSIIGPVKKCHLVRDKDGTFKGVAYIVYNELKDATEAVNTLNNSTLNEKIIKVKFTRQRDNESNLQPAGKAEANQEGSLDREKESKKRKRLEKKQKNRNGRIIIRNLSFKVRENFNLHINRKSVYLRYNVCVFHGYYLHINRKSVYLRYNVCVFHGYYF
ncbi:ELAV-like protein 2 [Portunus trituberculatus]|uniref:ELAV-like protein 2 n=1 Tax=Portunus trituberculatus TaxID=210409 RepID=A0A5B7HIB1_PORTR|nr:ELAV-like protein 2 [Portunus trituberculatus]